MRSEFVAERDRAVGEEAARLARLVALLPNCQSPGDELLLRQAIEQAARRAFEAATGAASYRRKQLAGEIARLALS